MFSQQELEARVAQANKQFVSGEEVLNAPPDPNAKSPEVAQIGSGKKVQPWVPIDLYQHNQRKATAMNRKEFPKGSRALVMAATKAIIEGEGGKGGLALAKKRAQGDSESYLASGDKERAEIAARQYMEEKFLPAVEMVIEYTSPDELLNCKEALAAFDELAAGPGSMSGYTAAYVRQAYEKLLGQKRGGSDPTVTEEMRRIRALVGSDEIRTAIGLAQRLKKQIDNGEHQASPEDYAVIGRVVAYAN